jgi:hypothetical protein
MWRLWEDERRMPGFGWKHSGKDTTWKENFDGSIISKWIFKKYDGKTRTGLICLRISTSGGLL